MTETSIVAVAVAGGGWPHHVLHHQTWQQHHTTLLHCLCHVGDNDTVNPHLWAPVECLLLCRLLDRPRRALSPPEVVSCLSPPEVVSSVVCSGITLMFHDPRSL